MDFAEVQKKRTIPAIDMLSKRAMTDVFIGTSTAGASSVKFTDQVVSAGDLDLTVDRPVVEAAVAVGQVDGVVQISAISDLVDLTDKSSAAKKKKKDPVFKGIFVSGSTESTEEESSRFPDAEGEVVMEYVMYSVMDTLETKDFDNTLAAVKAMCSDHCNIAAVKEELKSAKKAKVEVDEKLKKSEELWKGLLRANNEMHIDFDNRERAL